MSRTASRCLSALAFFAIFFPLLCTSAAAQWGGLGAPRRTGPQHDGTGGGSFTCAVLGADRICGSTAPILYNAVTTPNQGAATYTWTLHTTTTNGCLASGATNPSFFGPTNQSSVQVIPGTGGGRFVLKVFISNGFSEATCCLSIGVTPSTSTTTPPPGSVCSGDPFTFCTTASGTGPFTYQWTMNGVDIPGATDSCFTATAGSPGTVDDYCVTTTGSGACGVAFTVCTTLTAKADTTATSLPSTAICEGTTFTFCTTAGGTPPFTYQWTKNGVDIPGATNSCFTATASMAPITDEYCVTVTGCSSVTVCGSLRGQPSTTATPMADQSVCLGDTATFCTTAGGLGPFTFEWTQNGVVIAGATNSCYTATAGVPETEEFCVTVTGQCGQATQCATLTRKSETFATPIGSWSQCEGLPVVLCTIATGSGPFTYQWKKNGINIPGATDNCYIATAEPPVGSSDLYCVLVFGPCNTAQQCGTVTTIACLGSFTTLTQGTLGNPAGQYNGVSTPDLVEDLLQDNVVVGIVGQASLTLQGTAGDANCVVDLLPTTGVMGILPPFGDETLESDCQTFPVPIPVVNGDFESIVIGQVVTLSLNVKLNEGMTSGAGCTTIPADLATMGLCSTMVTRTLLPGPDGCMGTSDDEPDLVGPDGDPMTPDNLVTITIPPSVVTALNELTYLGQMTRGQTLGGIIELANLALAGTITPASLEDISAALDAANLIFESGRETMECVNP